MAAQSISQGGSARSPGAVGSLRGHTVSAAVCLVLLIIVGVLVHTGWGPLTSFDRSVTNDAEQATTDPNFRQFLQDWGGTFTPGFATITCIALAIALFFGGRVTLALATAMGAIVGNRLSSWLPTLITRPAPSGSGVHATVQAGFPSQHSFAAALACGLFTLALLSVLGHGLRWMIVTVLAAIALFTAYGEIALGEDYPSAALGGVLLGLLVTAAVGADTAGLRHGWRRIRS